MAPEQVEGRPADERADIFSLGVVLYEALSGRQPFRRESVVDTLHAILHDEPPPMPATVPQATQQIVARCLAKLPHPASSLPAISSLRSRLPMATM
jgi:serine/threonine-protein kinase